MNTQRTVLLGLLAAALAGLLLAGCQSPSQSRRSAGPAPAAVADSDRQAPAQEDQAGPEDTPETRSWAGTHPAPEFPPGLEWLNSEHPLSLAGLKGKVVVLDFWTYGCINCIHNLPWLKRLETEFAEELVVIGVHSAKFSQEGQTENLRNIVLRYDLSHPIVNDNEFQVLGMWGVQAWPTLVIIDPAGNVVGGLSGEGFYPVFRPIIESLIAEFDAAGALDRSALKLKLEREGLPATVLSFPGKLLADGEGRRLFIADTQHHRIVIAHMEEGTVLEVIGGGAKGFEDGDFQTAAFNQPQGLALSEDGDTLFVADTANHSIRRVDLAAREVSTLVGVGTQADSYPPEPGVAPRVALSSPWDLELAGGELYVAMAGSHQLWRVDLESGEVRALAGSGAEGFADGALEEAELAQPSGLSLDRERGRIYFADSEASTVRWVDLSRQEVGTLAGSGRSLFEFGDRDGVGGEALLQHPLGVVYHRGKLYVADTYNSKIKVADPDTREIRTLLGGERGWGDGNQARFYEPGGIDAYGDRLYVADTNNHSIRVVDLSSLTVTTLVLKGARALSRGSGFDGLGRDASWGRLIRLDPVELEAGSGRVRVEVELPAGYKTNDSAPSELEWEVEGEVVVLPADAVRSVVEPRFPLEQAVHFREGSGELTLELYLIYCEAEQDRLCLIERVRFEVPLRVSRASTEVGAAAPAATGAGTDLNTLVLRHRVEAPQLR